MRVFNDEENNRVEFLDERYYQQEGNYYPSVTTVLDSYPKGERFMQWLKDVGNEADNIVTRAAEQGTNVHNACELILKGHEVSFKNYTLDEWKMILRFIDFCETYNPQIEAIEHNLVSPQIGVGGTIDIVCKINGERWLIDNKTSAAIYDNHYVQIATYTAMWNAAYPHQRIDRIACLHLKALTQGPDKAGKKIQGKGWKLDEPDESPAELYEIFKHVFALWKRIHPHQKPMNLVLPATAKLKIKKEEVKKEKPKVEKFAWA